MTGVVIIGAGQAGFEVAFSLRAKGHQGSVVLVGEEALPPYQRPPLSKEHLLRDDEPVTYLRPASYYDEHGIELVLSSSAVSIDREARQVQLECGRSLPYDHLVLATGSTNRRLPIPGEDLDGVVSLRDARDSERVRALMVDSANVGVIGGGFIGLEVAAAAAQRGKRVTVIEAASRVMARVVSEPVSAYFEALHGSHGVDVRTDEVAEAFTGGSGRVSEVRTGSGQVVPADLAVVGIGALANETLAADAGLRVQDGIVVDDLSLTSDRCISAVGDCARRPYRGQMVRAESVHAAVHHARRIASRLVGESPGPEEAPWFWSHQYDTKLQIVGIPDVGGDLLVVRGDADSGRFSVFRFDSSDCLAAVESVNSPRDHMVARKLLRHGGGLTPAQAADPDTDLGDVAKAWLCR